MTLSEHLLAQAVEFLRTFAPEILERARGIDEAEIEEIERVIKRPLLAGHKTFLRRFGGNTKGELNPFLYDCEFDVGSIKKYHRRRAWDGTPVSIPPDWVFVMTMGATPEPYYLYSRGTDPEDPPIGRPLFDDERNCWADEVHIDYSSLCNEIILDAFAMVLGKDKELTTMHGWLWQGRELPLDASIANLQVTSNILVDLGFEPWLELHYHNWIFRRGSEVVLFGWDRAINPRKDTSSAVINGPDAKSVREVWEVLADNVGLTRWPVRE
jgi:hypothetical protein